MHVGTHSGNPISCAAGVATVRAMMRPGTYERLAALGRRLAQGLRDVAQRTGQEVYVVNEGPIVDLWFTSGTVESFPDIWSTDADRGRRYKLALLDRGIWSPPGCKMFLSLAHDENDIDATLQAAEDAMRSL